MSKLINTPLGFLMVSSPKTIWNGSSPLRRDPKVAVSPQILKNRTKIGKIVFTATTMGCPIFSKTLQRTRNIHWQLRFALTTLLHALMKANQRFGEWHGIDPWRSKLYIHSKLHNITKVIWNWRVKIWSAARFSKWRVWSGSDLKIFFSKYRIVCTSNWAGNICFNVHAEKMNQWATVHNKESRFSVDLKCFVPLYLRLPDRSVYPTAVLIRSPLGLRWDIWRRPRSNLRISHEFEYP